jgi:tryptophan synthase beta chain
MAREAGEERTILFNLSGHGMIDLYAYEQLIDGALKNHTLTDDEIAHTVSTLEKLV